MVPEKLLSVVLKVNVPGVVLYTATLDHVATAALFQTIFELYGLENVPTYSTFRLGRADVPFKILDRLKVKVNCVAFSKAVRTAGVVLRLKATVVIVWRGPVMIPVRPWLSVVWPKVVALPTADSTRRRAVPSMRTCACAEAKVNTAAAATGSKDLNEFFMASGGLEVGIFRVAWISQNSLFA